MFYTVIPQVRSQKLIIVVGYSFADTEPKSLINHILYNKWYLAVLPAKSHEFINLGISTSYQSKNISFPTAEPSLTEFGMIARLANKYESLHADKTFTPLQELLFTPLHTYHDILFSGENMHNHAEVINLPSPHLSPSPLTHHASHSPSFKWRGAYWSIVPIFQRIHNTPMGAARLKMEAYWKIKIG